MNVQRKGKEKQPGSPGGSRERASLLPAHIDHICREVAEFRSADASKLVDSCIAAFPDWLRSMPDVKRRHWWADNLCRYFPRDRYGGVRETCKYKPKIDELRDMWRAASTESLRIANRRGRLEMLQACYDTAVAKGQLRDAAYILSLAERETGSAEMHAGPEYQVEYTDAQTTDTPPIAAAPESCPGS